MGAPIEMSPNGDTSWSAKIVDDWEKFFPLKIDESNKTWKKMIEFHEAAERFCKDKCLLYNIDMHSNIDTLEGLRGAEKLMFDMIDKPDVVIKAMKQVRKLFSKVYNTFYGFGNKNELGTMSWLQMYSRGKHNPIQADYIALISPAMVRKFVLPAIEEEANFLDNSCFHLDGPDAFKYLDDILAIDEIDAVQWVPGAGRKPGYEWPEVINKIQSAGKAVVLYGSCNEIKAIHGRYKSELLVYDVQAENEAEGLELLEWLKKNT
jgi:hypothetical protein